MNKMLLALLMSFTLATTAFAAPSVRIERNTVTNVPISAALLDADPTSVTSSAIDVSGTQRITFDVSYDETQVGGVSAAFTVTGSIDGTTFISVPFFDVSGGVTPQTSETLTTDSDYIAWMLPELSLNFIKVIMTCTGCDVDDTVLTTVKVYLEN